MGERRHSELSPLIGTLDGRRPSECLEDINRAAAQPPCRMHGTLKNALSYNLELLELRCRIVRVGLNPIMALSGAISAAELIRMKENERFPFS
jgi:hypothetical protein